MILGFCNSRVNASHLFGGDIGYTHITGNTYEITLILYGDCSGSSYQGLFSATPQISIFNGTAAVASINLTAFGTLGLEVTPVCPAEINNTFCKSPLGTIPGVAQFIFKGTYTVNGLSSNWRFRFTGNLGGNAGAGRSNAITNINQTPNYTILALEATLNNINGPNTSAVYSSIPTPFFCVNIPQQYNQGAIDADGDQLSFSLTPALDGNSGGNVNYINPYTYDNPLSTTPGSFLFNASNGQMAFTPDAVQNSVVVNKVVETRNGVEVGSTMREMTFVILNNCNNQSPSGNITSTNEGSIENPTLISICDINAPLSFSISAQDPDGQNVSALITGLPAGATSSIIGNNTTNITINVNWPIPQPFTPGLYTFYITYQDDGCPLSSKQTIAYSVQLINPISATFSTDEESCDPANDGAISVNATSNFNGLKYSLDGVNYQYSNIFNGLSSGNQIVYIKDSLGCLLKDTIYIPKSSIPTIDKITSKNISCHDLNNGEINLTVSPLSTNYTFSISPLNLSNTLGIFKNLSENNYTVIVNTNKGCKDTAYVSIINPPQLEFQTIELIDASCNKDNGKIIITTNFLDSMLYFLTPGSIQSTTGYYDNLKVGTYQIQARNNQGCEIDTTVSINLNPSVFSLYSSHTDLECLGSGYDGVAEVFTVNGTAPFNYTWNTVPPQTTSKIENLHFGVYTAEVSDATGCKLTETIYIQPGTCCEQIYFPNAFTPNGDGLNDSWRITSTVGMELKEFAIFNRWGQSVWSSKNQFESWDGTSKGRDAEVATYYFVIKYKCLTDDKTYVKKGDISLIR